MHHYLPETKQISKPWTEARCSSKEKVKLTSGAGKIYVISILEFKQNTFDFLFDEGSKCYESIKSRVLHKFDTNVTVERSECCF